MKYLYIFSIFLFLIFFAQSSSALYVIEGGGRADADPKEVFSYKVNETIGELENRIDSFQSQKKAYLWEIKRLQTKIQSIEKQMEEISENEVNLLKIVKERHEDEVGILQKQIVENENAVARWMRAIERCKDIDKDIKKKETKRETLYFPVNAYNAYKAYYLEFIKKVEKFSVSMHE